MRKILSLHYFYIVLLSLLLAFVSVSFSQKKDSTTEHLTILYWNDFHAQNVPFSIKDSAGKAYEVGGTANFLGYLNKYRKENANTLVLNAGDDFQGTPISTLSHGRSQIELMNRIKPDAVCLGNHEFDYGIENLEADMEGANYPILCANVVNKTTGKTLGLSYLIKTVGKIKIGLIGVAPPDLASLTVAKNYFGYRLMNIDSSISRSIAEIKKIATTDLIILISHMGFDQDTALASRRNDINIIVGGHTHLALSEPLKKYKTIIVQAGSKGQYLGKLDITVDTKKDVVTAYPGKLIEMKSGIVPPDPSVEPLIKEYETTVNEMLGVEIGKLTTAWDRQTGTKNENNIGNFEADCYRDFAKTNIAFQSTFWMKKDIPAGAIRVKDIWELNPFENTIVTFTVNGFTLKKMLNWQARARQSDFVQVSGLKYVYDSSLPRDSMLLQAEVNGKPINDFTTYSVATNNYIGSHLKDIFGISNPHLMVLNTGIVDRDVIIDYIKKTKTIDSRCEGRIVDRAEKKDKK